MRPVHRPRRVTSMRGATVIELVTLLGIIGIMLSVVVAQLVPTQQEVLDRAGGPVLAAAVLDARAAASANHYQYSDATRTVAAMTAIAAPRSGPALSARYTTGPSQVMDVKREGGSATVSVDVAAPTVTTYALLTTQDARTGTATCWMAVDSLRSGTEYAVLQDQVTVTRNPCTAPVATACYPLFITSLARGTLADPHQLSTRDTCVDDGLQAEAEAAQQ